MQSCFRRITLILFLGVFTILNGSSQSLSSLIDSWQNKSTFQGATIGLSVRDLSNNALVYDHNGAANLCPASSLKAVTTGMALEELGSSFTYETTLSLTIEEGDTCLVLRGNGDPTLGSMRFTYQANGQEVLYNLLDDLLLTTEASAIKRIYLDPGEWPFNPIPADYGHEDLGQYYGAVAHSVNLNENVLRTYLKREKNFDAPWSLEFVPNIETQFDTIVYDVEDASTSSLAIQYPVGSKALFVHGKMKHGHWRMRVESALHHPEFAALSILQDKLRAMGNKGVILGDVFDQDRHLLIHESIHESPQLVDIAKQTNTWSVNIFADALMKTMLMKSGLETPQEFIESYARNHGIQGLRCRIMDGSGLSRSNIISANQMTQLVNHFAQNQANSTFQRSLAVLGRAGTLEELVPQGSPAIGRVFAKSGGLTGVLSYTGIVQTNKGKWLSFSLIINNHVSNNANLRLYLDRFFETLIEL
ncbi:MAG: D-alanyl-D-alanine carboxypeptidase/D-alanyl-D-alanine endopeptidase [Chitinophagales bacterium]